MDANVCEWPTEEAKRVKLFQPKELDQVTCFFNFEKKDRLLKLVQDGGEEEIILDVIDPKDIVGVNVEIEWIDQESDTTYTAQDTTYPLPQIYQQGEVPEKYHKVPAQNESGWKDAVDRRARAILSVFVYPKRRMRTKKSILRFCGSERSNSRTPKKAIVVPDDMVYRSGDKSDSMEMNKFVHRYSHHRRFIVAPVEDFTDLSIMVNAIQNLSRPNSSLKTKSSIAEERILVIVNPTSGRKMGINIYDETLRPMLEQAGIAYDCLITTHPQHAEERMKKQNTTSDFRDLTEYTGIVLVGGDGTIHQVLQGIHRRDDRDKILERIKFGAIAAGTSNGFTASLAHASKENHSPLESAFMIVKGMSSPVDISQYETNSNSYISFLTFSWAMIADIDVESECIRWAGFLRMDIWGVVRLLFLRKYRAKFSYLQANTGTTTKSIPPLNEPIPDSNEWVTCEDDFILFWASQMTHAGEQMFNAPSCKIDDGIFHIMIVRGDVSRIQLALILLSMESGGHKYMTGVEFIECSAYRLEPITQGSFNDLDGEVIEAGA
eukprot:CAMPEP_0197179878 /NCGR_PEP_ID=MMETSP1423-20130617/4686_1 /TAXON_ID=476441 /ORGANISM="Pseudo-nitzschia heimii, Strain UNC1101" /LENGTH=548 /DNA_ID=CAMNT_0042629863 /DNA_START=1 /DNA_END=1644 /DNA_ORIENTATION=-